MSPAPRGPATTSRVTNTAPGPAGTCGVALWKRQPVTHRFREQSACNTRLIGRCQQVEAVGRSCCSSTRQDVSGFGDVALG